MKSYKQPNKRKSRKMDSYRQEEIKLKETSANDIWAMAEKDKEEL